MQHHLASARSTHTCLPALLPACQSHIHVGARGVNGPIGVWLITKERRVLNPPMTIRGSVSVEVPFNASDLTVSQRQRAHAHEHAHGACWLRAGMR